VRVIEARELRALQALLESFGLRHRDWVFTVRPVPSAAPVAVVRYGIWGPELQDLIGDEFDQMAHPRSTLRAIRFCQFYR
jgi:hypothetical protein